MLILSGPRPARSAASIPRSTSATGKSASFMRRKIASSMASRLTVTRPQARGLQRRRLALEDRAVGRQREVERRAVGARQLGEHRDQPLEVAPQERLAAGEADLLHAVRDEQPREADDLLEGQQRRVRQERVLLVEHLLRHAVAAAEVAAVGDRDAQVAQRPIEAVVENAGGRVDARRNGRRARAIAVIGDGDDFVGHARLCLAGPSLHPEGDASCRRWRGRSARPRSMVFGTAAAVVTMRRAPVKRFAQYAKLMSSVRTFAPRCGAWMKWFAPM